MEGKIFYIGPRFDFITKIGKLVVIFFPDIYSSFHKIRTKIYTSIQILRHLSLHIYIIRISSENFNYGGLY